MTAMRRSEGLSTYTNSRKRPVYTVSRLKRAPSLEKRRIRSVYIVAKPLRSAGQLASLSEGKFPLCHWGLLVSPYNARELHRYIQYRSKNGCGCGDWGTLFEIVRIEGRHEVNKVEHFGSNLLPEWSCFCIAYVGVTQLPDRRIFDHGIPLIITTNRSIRYRGHLSRLPRIFK